MPEDLQPEGFVLTVEGWSDEPGYALALTSLDASGAKLLSVTPATENQPERAHVWMSFTAVDAFLRKLDQFAAEETSRGAPRNQELVANIAAIRLAMLEQLWQEDEPFPGEDRQWWEVWFARLPKEPDPTEVVPRAAEQFGLGVGRQMLSFPERTVALVSGTAEQLGSLLTTNAVVAELRRPRLVTDIFQLDVDIQEGLIEDLEERVEPAGPNAPAVCLLDTGITRGHRLLRQSIDGTYTVLDDATTADRDGHGTKMAGLALFGDLEDALDTHAPIRLCHRLESVKVIEPSSPGHPRELLGVVTAQATAAPEIDKQRPRAFSIPLTDTLNVTKGRPSSWSAAIDALAFGTDIDRSDEGVELLGRPDPKSSRLMIVSAGNVVDCDAPDDYLDHCDTRPVEDPAQAWNALVVGAHTERVDDPGDPTFAGYRPVAPAGELSPYSRTSVLWPEEWALRPDIVLEGGNLLVDQGGHFRGDHDCVNLLTTGRDGMLDTANGTSASTAQAARLAALVWDRYPALWPETVRGLLVHAAEWTPAMAAQINDRNLTKTKRARLLRRYGWGVPTEERVLYSATNRATLLVEDEYQPFEFRNGNIAMRALRLHELPWPRDQLIELFAADVRMRVTLSYFTEPNPSNRGWKAYRYPSHRLRFDVKRRAETFEEFRARINHEAQRDEEGRRPSRTTDRRWQIGPETRNRGSLHADIWTGQGADLAECDAIAVIPVGGWWKDNRRKDRSDLPVRYSLLVSLYTEVLSVDIYTPIATQIGIPVEIQT